MAGKGSMVFLKFWKAAHKQQNIQIYRTERSLLEKGKGIIVSLKNIKLGLIILIEMSWIAAQIVMGI